MPERMRTYPLAIMPTRPTHSLITVTLSVLVLLVSSCYANVVLYSNPDQGGASVTFGVGRKRMANTPVGDEAASSITVASGWLAHVCSGPTANPDRCIAFGPNSVANFPSAIDNLAKSVHVQKIKPQRQGLFGNVKATSSAPIWASLGPDGNVLFFKIGFRRKTEIFFPSNGTVARGTLPPYDWFCTGLALDCITGDIIMGGGNKNFESRSARFSWDTYSWTQMGPMGGPSYYGTTNALPDGSVVHALGSTTSGVNIKTQNDFLEILDPGSDSWRTSTTDLSPLYLDPPRPRPFASNWFPYLFVVSDGTMFHCGPVPRMHSINMATNRVTYRGLRGGGDQHRHWGSPIMYDAKGLILVAGGTAGKKQGFSTTNTVAKIDVTDPSNPKTSFTGSMKFSRAFHCLVVLANGDVFVSGGSGFGLQYTGDQPRYRSEIWSPKTDRWRPVAQATIKRMYHSSALLLKDGTVFTGGGQADTSGSDGDQDSISIFYPPYLYNPDGSLKDRPVITSGPNSMVIGGPRVNLVINSALPITRITALRHGTSNHQINLDSRFLDMTAEGLHNPSAGATQRVSAFPNENVMLPGYWMFFAFNSAGVPSEAITILVKT